MSMLHRVRLSPYTHFLGRSASPFRNSFGSRPSGIRSLTDAKPRADGAATNERSDIVFDGRIEGTNDPRIRGSPEEVLRCANHSARIGSKQAQDGWPRPRPW